MSENFQNVALFAAVIAAVVSSLATATIARRQRNFEHHQWLRNRKQEAYVQFWDARREFLNAHKRVSNPDVPVNRDLLLKGLRPTTIRMLAPKDITELAYEIYKDTKQLISDDGQKVPLDSEIRERVKVNSDRFMTLVIEDLRPTHGVAAGRGRRLFGWFRRA